MKTVLFWLVGGTTFVAAALLTRSLDVALAAATIAWVAWTFVPERIRGGTWLHDLRSSPPLPTPETPGSAPGTTRRGVVPGDTSAKNRGSQPVPVPGDPEPVPEVAEPVPGVAGTSSAAGTGSLRRMSDVEIVALLAMQRSADGAWRFSANAIAQLVGGRRDAVLGQIRALRGENAAVYPPLTPAQARLRRRLRL
jgi:hypothetical protein